MMGMAEMTVRNRRDGVVEIAPKLARPGGTDRMLFIATVLLVAGALFVSGVLPAPVLVAIAASCLAGELILGVKALALVVLREPAPVHEVVRWRSRRR